MILKSGNPKALIALVLSFLDKEEVMKIGHLEVKIFKIRNRTGYAAICCDHLTEGKTEQEAFDRMVKALRRTENKISG